MQSFWRSFWRNWPWWAVWLAVTLLGATLLVRMDIASRREVFQADARIAHRLLSQRVVQHEAVLATLTLVGSSVDPGPDLSQALSAVYPQVLEVLWHNDRQAWSGPSAQALAALTEAEARSHLSGHAELGWVDPDRQQYTVVKHSLPTSFALRIDVQRMVPWAEWPIARQGAVGVTLRRGDQLISLQTPPDPSRQPMGWTQGYRFGKLLAAPGQDFELSLQQATGPAQWPWHLLWVWALLTAITTAALQMWWRARRERHHAQELLRVTQLARLNAMGEMAAGIAHEVSQPLTAILAGAQAAVRLLDDDPPQLDTARQALGQVVTQGRRAADVVDRLRRRITSGASGAGTERQAVALLQVVRQVLDLLAPQLQASGVSVSVLGAPVQVLADPVALEQVVHNLLGNALEALTQVPVGERELVLRLQTVKDRGVLSVRDTGIGIAEDNLPRLFEPFFTTRPTGLGLGLSLCETLVHGMGGTLRAGNAETRGAEFTLTLPLTESTS